MAERKNESVAGEAGTMKHEWRDLPGYPGVQVKKRDGNTFPFVRFIGLDAFYAKRDAAITSTGGDGK